jgi:sugar O-acyltransferase (sialic acid O-acetyltransferase NeuD family)
VKDKLILVGGGGHCRSCVDVIEEQGLFSIAGIIDEKDKIGTHVLGYPVIASDDDLARVVQEYRYFLITIGQIGVETKRAERFELIRQLGGAFPSVISPFAHVSKHAAVGDGSIIMHRAVINAGATIGCNCIINTGAIIEHDAVIDNHCHIATSAVINGDCRIGQYSFIGSSSVLRQDIALKAKSFVRANSLVKESNG